MEPGTILVLAIQLVALFSIAGGLLLYLLCKVRGGQETTNRSKGGTILITSADTALGLQLCTYLAGKGCRVFAGMKDNEDSLPAKLLKGWMKMRENLEVPLPGSIVTLKIDVTREDILREATEAMGAHLNAGERGILAVINTAGAVFKGRIENQDSQQWDTMFKTNVLGSLRTARAFIGLLKPTRGRLIYIGSGTEGDGLVAFNASRIAVDGCANSLRRELQPYGIHVIALDSHGVPAESLFRAPIPYHMSAPGETGAPTQYSAEVLTASALSVIEHALWDPTPLQRYQLSVPHSKFNVRLPCKGSFRLKQSTGIVQKIDPSQSTPPPFHPPPPPPPPPPTEPPTEPQQSSSNTDDAAVQSSQTMTTTTPGRDKLKSWLYRTMKIVMTDGRILMGAFLCTDADANVILGMCSEDTQTGGEERALGLVMVPGRHIVSMHIDESPQYYYR